MADIFLDTANLIVLIFLLRGKNEKTWNCSSPAGSQYFFKPFYNPLDNLK